MALRSRGTTLARIELGAARGIRWSVLFPVAFAGDTGKPRQRVRSRRRGVTQHLPRETRYVHALVRSSSIAPLSRQHVALREPFTEALHHHGVASSQHNEDITWLPHISNNFN